MPTGASAEPENWIDIGSLASRYGISLRAIRFYEQKGLLCPRRDAYTRYYNQWDQLRLELITRGKRLGFSLAEIGEIIGYVDRGHRPIDPLQHDDFLAAVKPEVLHAQLRRLEQRRGNLDLAIAELKKEQAHAA